jgi:NTE family protein
MNQPDPVNHKLWADLVLEGGGVKGIALLGAIDHLAEHGYQFNRIAGSSVGALMGAFIATQPDGTIDRDHLRALVFGGPGIDPADTLPKAIVKPKATPPTRPSKPNIGTRAVYLVKLARFGVRAAGSILTKQGVYGGDELHNWIQTHLPPDQPQRLDQLTEPNPPIGVPPRQRFVVTAVDLTKGELLHLPDPTNAPWMTDLADAVRASTAIPFVFQPFRKGPPTGPAHCYVDGGTLSNFPIDVFDAPPGSDIRHPTFGLHLSAGPSRDNPTSSTRQEIRALLDTFTGFYDRTHRAQINDERIMHIDTGTVTTTDFNIGTHEKQQLFNNGRQAAQDLLNTFDFEIHKKHRGL